MQINPTVLLHWDTCDWLRFSAYCLDIKKLKLLETSTWLIKIQIAVSSWHAPLLSIK